VADRKKMEGHYSTGQSPQWAVVPMEEEEEVIVVNVMTEYVMSFRVADREIVSNLPRNISTFLHSSEWISLPKLGREFNAQFVLRQVLRLPKRVLQTVRTSVSFFEFQYISLKSSSNRLRLLPLLLVPILSSNNVFKKAVPMQDVKNPFSLLRIYCV